MKYSTRVSRSLYTINKMNAHKHLFSECIWTEKELFEKSFIDLRVDHESSDLVLLEKENLLKEKKDLLKLGYQLFLDGKDRVKRRNKQNVKLYFNDFDSKNTKNNLKNIYSALSNALIMIKNEDLTVLNLFEGEYKTITDDIRTFLSEKDDRLYKLENADKETKSLEKKWDKEYQSLKYFVKAYCYKKDDMNSDDYFEDLGLPSTHNKKDETPEVVVENKVENNVVKNEVEESSEKPLDE